MSIEETVETIDEVLHDFIAAKAEYDACLGTYHALEAAYGKALLEMAAFETLYGIAVPEAFFEAIDKIKTPKGA